MPEHETEDVREYLKRVATEACVPVDCTLDLTTRCNYSCVHCYLADTGKQHMDTDVAYRVIGDLVEAGTVWLTITGGEPTLHPDFAEIYTLAAESGIVQSLFTNGSALDFETLDLLTHDPPRLLQVSMYGATQETYEMVTRAKGSWERFKRGVEAAAQAGLPLGLKWVALRGNVDELEQGAEFAASLGAAFAVEALITPGLDHSVGPTAHRLDATEIVRLCSEGWHLVPDRRASPIRRSAFECSAGCTLVHVSADGTVHPCTMCQQGDVRQSRTLESGWDHVGKLVREPLAGEAACTTCEVYQDCPVCPGWESLHACEFGQGVEWLCELAYTVAQARGEEVLECQTPSGTSQEWTPSGANTPQSRRLRRVAPTSDGSTASAASSPPVASPGESQGTSLLRDVVELTRPVVVRSVAGEAVVVARGHRSEDVPVPPRVLVINDGGRSIVEALAYGPCSVTKLAEADGVDFHDGEVREFLAALEAIGLVKTASTC